MDDSIRRVINAVKEAKGLTQYEIAQGIGLHPARMSTFMREHVQAPQFRATWLGDLCRVLGVRPAAFWGGDDAMSALRGRATIHVQTFYPERMAEAVFHIAREVWGFYPWVVGIGLATRRTSPPMLYQASFGYGPEVGQPLEDEDARLPSSQDEPWAAGEFDFDADLTFRRGEVVVRVPTRVGNLWFAVLSAGYVTSDTVMAAWHLGDAINNATIDALDAGSGGLGPTLERIERQLADLHRQMGDR